MGLPTDYKVGGGYRKRILRDAVHELPALIAQRRDKTGFASPDANALRARVSEVRDTLYSASKNFTDIIDNLILFEAFEGMVADHAWYSPVFLRVLALDGWRRAHNVTV